jgi:hypothetical protein
MNATGAPARPHASPRNRMKKIFMLCAVSSVIAGCGGGGSAGSASTPALTSPSVQVPPTPVLTAYVGTWVGDCSEHQQETIVVSMLPDGGLTASSELTWFAAAGCSGQPVATGTMSANYSVNYADTVDAVFSLGTGAPATSLKVDRITKTVPSYTNSVTGSGVTSTTIGGGTQACVNYNNAETACISVGMHPGYSQNQSLHVAGNDLFFLLPDGVTYKVDYHYAKKQ